MTVRVRCSRCGNTLIEGNVLKNAIKYFDYKMPEGKTIDKGIICVYCGRYISEKKLAEVIERAGGSNKESNGN